MAQLARIAAACDLTIPTEHRRPVGIIGAGSIVDVAHLPAYSKAGLEVVAIVDRDLDRANLSPHATGWRGPRQHR